MSDVMTPDTVENPFPETSTLLVDMTKHTGMFGSAKRVELRRVREPVVGPMAPTARIAESSFVIGLVREELLPKEGVPFEMPYHLMSGNTGYGVGYVIDFGYVDSNEPVKNVAVIGQDHYFETSEGLWRLRILDKGN